MLLKRAELLKLTNMEADRYNSLVRRGLLPFADGDRDEPNNGAWRRFTPMEAFMAILADELAKTATVDQSTAAKIVSCAATPEIWVHLNSINAPLFEETAQYPEIFLGATWIDVKSPIGDPLYVKCGTLNEITLDFSKLRKTSIVMTNATRAAGLMKYRAAEFGIEIPHEYWMGGIRGPAHVERED